MFRCVKTCVHAEIVQSVPQQIWARVILTTRTGINEEETCVNNVFNTVMSMFEKQFGFWSRVKGHVVHILQIRRPSREEKAEQ